MNIYIYIRHVVYIISFMHSFMSNIYIALERNVFPLESKKRMYIYILT